MRRVIETIITSFLAWTIYAHAAELTDCGIEIVTLGAIQSTSHRDEFLLLAPITSESRLRLFGETVQCHGDKLTYQWTLSQFGAERHAELVSSEGLAVLSCLNRFVSPNSYEIQLVVSQTEASDSVSRTIKVHTVASATTAEFPPSSSYSIALLPEPVGTKAIHGLPLRLGLHFETSQPGLTDPLDFAWKVFGHEYRLEAVTGSSQRNLALNDSVQHKRKTVARPWVSSFGWMFNIPYELIEVGTFDVSVCVRIPQSSSTPSFRACSTRQVNISTTALVAQIGDGSNMAYVNARNEKIVLNASSSYDPDFGPQNMVNDHLDFEWVSCHKSLSPTLWTPGSASDCSSLFDGKENSRVIEFTGEQLRLLRLDDGMLTYFKFTLKVSQGIRASSASRVYVYVPDDDPLPYALIDSVQITDRQGNILDRLAADSLATIVIDPAYDRASQVYDSIGRLLEVSYEFMEPWNEIQLDSTTIITEPGFWLGEDFSQEALPLGLLPNALREATHFKLALSVERMNTQSNQMELAFATKHQAGLVIESYQQDTVETQLDALFIKVRPSFYSPSLRFFFSIRDEQNMSWCLEKCNGDRSYVELFMVHPGKYQVTVEMFDQTDHILVDRFDWDIRISMEKSRAEISSDLKRLIAQEYYSGNDANFLHYAMQYTESILLQAREDDKYETDTEGDFLYWLLTKIFELEKQSVLNARLSNNFVELASKIASLHVEAFRNESAVRLLMNIASEITSSPNVNAVVGEHVDILSTLMVYHNNTITLAWQHDSLRSSKILYDAYQAAEDHLARALVANEHCGFSGSVSTAIPGGKPASMALGPIRVYVMNTCSQDTGELDASESHVQVCEDIYGGGIRSLIMVLSESPDYVSHAGLLGIHVVNTKLVGFRILGDATDVSQLVRPCFELRIAFDKNENGETVDVSKLYGFRWDLEDQKVEYLPLNQIEASEPVFTSALTGLFGLTDDKDAGSSQAQEAEATHSPSASKQSGGLTTGVIVGLAVGMVVAVSAFVVATVLFVRQQGERKKPREQNYLVADGQVASPADETIVNMDDEDE